MSLAGDIPLYDRDGTRTRYTHPDPRAGRHSRASFAGVPSVPPRLACAGGWAPHPALQWNRALLYQVELHRP